MYKYGGGNTCLYVYLLCELQNIFFSCCATLSTKKSLQFL